MFKPDKKVEVKREVKPKVDPADYPDYGDYMKAKKAEKK